MKRLPVNENIWIAEIFGISFTAENRSGLWDIAKNLTRLKIAEAENELSKFKASLDETFSDNQNEN
jgi:hypothetical protein